MSHIKNGMICNSFYEIDEEFIDSEEELTEGELIEYKRLIGMPISDDYEELIASLKDNSQQKNRNLKVSRVQFNDYDFMRLFLAYVRINGCVFIDKDRLRYDLYNLYKKEEYKELFQDIAIKQQIEGNFLDIEEALQNAQLCGLLSFHGSNPSSSKRMILINEDESFSIIDSYGDNYTSMMDELVGEFFDNSKNKDVKYHFEGKIMQLEKRYQQSK